MTTDIINDVHILKVGEIFELNGRYLLFTSGNIFDNVKGTYANIPKDIKEVCEQLKTKTIRN